MKFLGVSASNDWASLNPTENPDFASVRSRLERALSDVMLSENLIVLTGLGTSLCLKDSNGKVLAPTMSDLWDSAKQKAGEQFESVKTKVHYSAAESGDNIEHLLSRCQMSEKLNHDPEVEKFVSETEALIVEKCRFVDAAVNLSAHEAFLRKIARRSTRLPRVELFTTNYDLSFEGAASNSRFIVIDGFSHVQPQEFDAALFSYDLVRRKNSSELPEFVPNVFHLYKLHGSLDWERQEGRVIKEPKTKKPLIIFPRESKFESSYDQPFLELMARFQSGLREANTGLLIIGDGFNDHHITQPILSAIRSNIGLKAIIVDPAAEQSTNSILRSARDLVSNGDTRVSLAAVDFEQLVTFVPDLVAATEEETHLDRVRKIQAG